MKEVVLYLKPHLRYAVLAPAFMLIEVVCELMLPKMMAGIVNYGIADKDALFIAKHGAIMIILMIFGVLGGILCTYFASKTSQYLSADLRAAVFRKIQSFSFTNLDSFETSSLITRMTNDITQLQHVTLISLRMLVRAPLLFIGSVIMVFFINKELTLILSAAIIIIIITGYLVLTVGTTLFGQVQKKVDALNTVMRENLSGIRVVKAFVREDYEKKKFKISSSELTDTTIHAFRVMSMSMPVFTLSMNIALSLILWFGGRKLNTGILSTGDFMAYINYLNQILMALMLIGTAVSIIARGKASIDRIGEVLNTDIDIIDPENPAENPITKGTIEFKNVSFRYPGSTGEPVLSNINLIIPHGRTVGILGRTGSGKSTFVNLIPRLYDTSEGEILIDGVDIRRMRLNYLRGQIGVVLQQAILFSGTIKDNIKWGDGNASDLEIENAEKSACAYEFIDNFTNKSDTLLNQLGTNMSGGQKQRISIARTLLKKPKILILDDSTSAVDSLTELKIHKSLNENLSSSTKIIVAQKISSVINADKIVIIDNGLIVAEGSHEELLNSSKDYMDIYNSQILKEASL